ncbi:MAG: hypothetical protein E6J85_03635 [Deltaproteobacteria bacterium]|nr:MAG: hypothetical protein E6J85_03635 [Deltaproteobacteria bacterium]
MVSKKSSTPVVLIAALAMGTTLWAREARGAAAGDPVLVVPVHGSVKGTSGSISFSGDARVTSHVRTDTEFGDPPGVTVYVNLKGVTGTDDSGKKYEASGEQQIVRPFQESDTIEVTFSYHAVGSDTSGGGAGTMSFKLRFDSKTGTLLQADGRFEE